MAKSKTGMIGPLRSPQAGLLINNNVRPPSTAANTTVKTNLRAAPIRSPLTGIKSGPKK